MKNQLVIVLDFGGQYSQLIARRVRECNVYCEIHSYKTPAEEIKKLDPKAIIFSGGPNSVYLENAPKIGKDIFELGVPILGICYGSQLMSHILGGSVVTSSNSEYGKTITQFDNDSSLYKSLPKSFVTWMSHTDRIDKLPEGFKVTATTEDCPVASMANEQKKFFGVQFHPEVMHTENGMGIIKNFLYNISGLNGDWKMKDYAKSAIEEIKNKVGDKKVLLGLSGGVDSSVCAALVSKAVGNNLTCIFVDHGLMRKDEGDEIEKAFADWDINLIRVNAGERFLAKLDGVSDPETKRKIIGEEFIRVFEDEKNKIQKCDFLVQGTIYPDVIESGLGEAAVIKSHHNVGGLPKDVDFQILEPLRLLFKDEVRTLGRELGVDPTLVERQPFPGPGLAVRIIGEITPDRVKILQEADFIFREEIAASGLDKVAQQYFAVLTSLRSVGVMGDFRTYDYTLALRAVTTSDFMTADFVRIPYEVLEKISVRIVNEVKHINRIVYDITTKPPATIEWE